MDIFLQGLTMGLAYLAPIGAQNLFVINTALTAPLSTALATAGIVTFFDISLALACFWGIGLIIGSSLLLQKAILCGGGLILIYIGWQLLRAKVNTQTSATYAPPFGKQFRWASPLPGSTPRPLLTAP